MLKKERLSCYRALVFCVIAFIAGEFLLNSVAPMEHPPLGRTFNIVVGCGMMIFSVVSVVLLIKHLIYLDRKEKKRKNNPVPFLEDQKQFRRKKHS